MHCKKLHPPKYDDVAGCYETGRTGFSYRFENANKGNRSPYDAYSSDEQVYSEILDRARKAFEKKLPLG